jgi:gas vesicle protein
MQNTNTSQPGTPVTGQKPSTNDTDVNQTDHISSQLDQDDSDLEDNNDDIKEEASPVLDEEDLEENNITDEEADDIEWDPNQQRGDKGDGNTL